ncbi:MULTISPECIES: MFS transporter [Thiorhodovibrio]|uniref:MFS transporter n=1 Tax=Thiorhodovibrio TaxID=61593 RepID=UPI0019113335|nr:MULTISPECIES: MFS transporter [Thiorhodovibrio]MBK5970645.1 MFS transporter [Thiorhodovibrio winogradskyi]WPL12461.1 Major Facilitator Superfamily protein [Thiorhodovibrio litoralis]
MRHANALDSLYDLVTGDEDARVCKDIPAASCNDQPRNFFAYLLANLLTKVADELASAKLLLPWLFGALGAPALLVGFLVPIREAGVLLPQLAVAAVIRQRPLRKPVWILGALLSALALALMAASAAVLRGAEAGWTILALLVLFSLARGLCSVSAKDVLGKTVSKSRRGRLMGLSAGIAGTLTLVVGLYLEFLAPADAGIGIFVLLLAVAAALFVLGALAFQGILEQPGATSGGGNALETALESISLLKTDPLFLRFVLVRIALLSVALTAPFYVLLAQQQSEGNLAGLGLLIIASGLASSISAPLWGGLSDRSSRWVMMLAAAMAGALGLFTWLLAQSAAVAWLGNPFAFAGIFLLLGIAHAGVRIGRKVYLVDMASADQRAAMVAVSNSVIGLAMLVAGPVGLLGDRYGPALVVLVLGVGALIAAALAAGLKEVSEPATA